MPQGERVQWAKSLGLANVLHDDVWHLGSAPNPPLPDNLASNAESVIGLVGTETDINQLRFEIVRGDLDIAEGDLVSVSIGTNKVLYQVLNGLTKEEIVEQKNTRGYVSARARKIGVWNDDTQRLGIVNWLPEPNAIVRCENKQSAAIDWRNLGYFPNTAYGIGVDPDTLVTQATGRSSYGRASPSDVS
jgi:hypothetical protein